MVRLLPALAVALTAPLAYAAELSLFNGASGTNVVGPKAAASGGDAVGYDGGSGCTPLEDTLMLTVEKVEYTLSKRTGPCRDEVILTNGGSTTRVKCPTVESTSYEDKSKEGHQLVMTMICKEGFWNANGLLIKEGKTADDWITYSLTVEYDAENSPEINVVDENERWKERDESNPVTCGFAAVPNSTDGAGRRRLLDEPIRAEDIRYHPLNHRGRKLKYDYFADCWEGQDMMHTMSIGVTVGQALFDGKLNRNMKTTQQYVDGIINKANKMYEGNFNIRLVLGHLVVKPDFEPKCSDKIEGQLDKLRVWEKPSIQADWQHLDDCFGEGVNKDSGTIGLAYVGTVCGGNYATGINWKSKGLSGKTWKTFAHELGHNIGASHTFEEGKGKTGGIMDYGGMIRGYTGGWSGEVQFNKQYRKDDVCVDLKKQLPICKRAKTFMSLSDKENTWYTDGNGAGRASGSATPATLMAILAAPAAALAQRALFA